jgi:threonine aldolase
MSDNNASVHPLVLAAIAQLDEGHAVAYGDDPTTSSAVERFREHLGDSVEVYFVFNGTGANVTGLQTMTRSYEAVICTECAHINVDECAAPEKLLGSKLIDLPSEDAKLTPQQVISAYRGIGDEHHVQAKVVSITQSSELGTVYTIDEIAALAEVAHARDMYLHMDGARISNAAASLGVELRETTGDAGVDVMSFGGTKNGLLGAEAVVFFRPELAERYRFWRKQSMQLASKMRYISVQFEALLTDDLWRRNATHANDMAQQLARRVAGVSGVHLTQAVQANAVFATLPTAAIPELQAHFPFGVWDEPSLEDAAKAKRSQVRWMCSWDTTASDVDRFARHIAEIVPLHN